MQMDYTTHAMDIITFEQTDIVMAWSNQGDTYGPDSVDDMSDK